MFLHFPSQGLADNTVIAKVNNNVWDLDRPLEDDCSLQLLKFDDEEAQAVSPPHPWSAYTWFFFSLMYGLGKETAEKFFKAS